MSIHFPIQFGADSAPSSTQNTLPARALTASPAIELAERVTALTLRHLEEEPSCSSQVFCIPELLEKILSNLEIPDLVPAAQVRSTWRHAAINSYWKEQKELMLHALQFLRDELEKIQPDPNVLAARVAFDGFLTTIHETTIANFTEMGALTEKIRMDAVKYLINISPTDRAHLSEKFTYERKPSSLLHLMDLARDLSLLRRKEPGVDANLTFQNITKYDWKFAIQFMLRIPDTDNAHICLKTACIIGLESQGRFTVIFDLLRTLLTQHHILTPPFHKEELTEPEVLFSEMEQKLSTMSLLETWQEDKHKLLFKMSMFHLYLGHHLDPHRNPSIDTSTILGIEVLCQLISEGRVHQAMTFAANYPNHTYPREYYFETIANQLATTGFCNKALEILRPLPEIAGDPSRGIRQVTDVLLQLGRLDEVKALLTTTTRKDVDTSWEELSRAYEQKGLIEEAEDAALKIHLTTDGRTARNNRLLALAQKHFQKENYDRAITLLKEIDDERNGELLTRISTIFMLQERFDKALDIAIRAPNRYRTHILRESVHRFVTMGLLERAKQAALLIHDEREQSCCLGEILLKHFPNVQKVLELFSNIQIEQLPDAMREEVLHAVEIVSQSVTQTANRN